MVVYYRLSGKVLEVAAALMPLEPALKPGEEISSVAVLHQAAVQHPFIQL